MLAYLSRHTQRVAIANSRLIAFDDNGVTFRWKDYRARGRERQKVMTLASGEFIRRFLIHVLPSGFHRIRHYGLFANGGRAENLSRVHDLLAVPATHDEPDDADASADELAAGTQSGRSRTLGTLSSAQADLPQTGPEQIGDGQALARAMPAGSTMHRIAGSDVWPRI